MGRRGPSKKPTAVAKAEGRQASKLNHREPQPAVRELKCPVHLVKVARDTWKKLVPMLFDMGVLTVADENALARYCECWALWRKASGVVRRKGPTGEDGRARAEVKISREVGAEMHRIEMAFGMNPSARASLYVDGSKKTTKEPSLEEFSKRKPRLTIAKGA